MGMCKQICIVLVVAAVVGGSLQTVLSSVVSSADVAIEFPQATLACKVKMGAITESEVGSPSGSRCDATCEVISWLKGDLGKEVKITFNRHANGPWNPEVDAVKAGEVYVVMLRGKSPPYQMFAAMRATDAVV